MSAPIPIRNDRSDQSGASGYQFPRDHAREQGWRQVSRPSGQDVSRTLLSVRNIDAGYKRRQVLQSVSMDVPEGSVVGIVGPSGHGKSTLLCAIAGLHPIWAGDVFLAGLSMQDLAAHERAARGVVHVPQGDLVFPEMTIEENLRLGAILVKSDEEVQRRLTQVFDIFPDLLERRTQIAENLFGRERRLLGIARGLMTGGRIILLDEPSFGLAPGMVDQIYQDLTPLRAMSTLVIVEQDPARLQGIADYIYVMERGEFVWNGRSEEFGWEAPTRTCLQA